MADGSTLTRIINIVSDVIGAEPAETPADLPLSALGVDSLDLVDIDDEIMIEFGLAPEKSLLDELSFGLTIQEIASWVDKQCCLTETECGERAVIPIREAKS